MVNGEETAGHLTGDCANVVGAAAIGGPFFVRSFLGERDFAKPTTSVTIPARAAYPHAAAQTRIVSKARIRLDSGKSVRSFKGIICVDISEFESFSIGAGWCQALSDSSVDPSFDVARRDPRFSSGSALWPSHDGIRRMRRTNLTIRPYRKSYGRY